MDKEEWIRRCAARYVSESAIDNVTATQLAETNFEEMEGDSDDPSNNPEESADVDMSYWDDD